MLTGQTLAQFEVLESIGAGELGDVYLARDNSADRMVEIETPAAGVDIARLRQEVQAASALSHWSIARIYEAAHAGDTDFVVREHVTGKPIAAGAPLECAQQIAGALAAGHAVGVTHRHLNPGNILVDEKGAVKLVNFGLTPARREEKFLAPEQLDGRGADARSDIYAFGMVLREMTGPAAPRALERIIARCTQKSVARRYQLMEDVVADLERIGKTAADPTEPGRRVLKLVAAGVVIAVAIGWWMLGGRDGVARGPAKLTSDTGLSTEATISRDGKWIAYASDRGSAGVLHIWTQPVSGGQAARITDGADDDHAPAISPDGKRIVFRSERDDGGLYAVAAGGGAAELLAKGGRDARFSPDGRWVVYWTGDSLTPLGAGVWTIAASGGAPKRLHAEFADARYPVWSPDGKHVLFVGMQDAERWMGNRDWYVASFAEGVSDAKVIRTGAENLLHVQGMREVAGFSASMYAIPEAWIEGEVLLAGRIAPIGPRRNAGPSHLLRMPINPGILEATGAAHEITSGADWDMHPAAASNGRLVFSRREIKQGIWSVAVDGSGDLHEAVADGGDPHPAISLDGKRLAYRFHKPDGHDEVRVIDLASGQQIARLDADENQEGSPLLSPSGEEVIYTSRGLMRAHLPDGAAEQVKRRRGGWDPAVSWSADGKRVLVQQWRRGIGVLDLASGEMRDFLRSDRQAPIVDARYSPDGKYVAFTVMSRPHPQIFVTAEGGVAGDASWIAVTGGEVSAGSPAWSADGGQIYFLSACHGFRCIWARKLDGRKKPAGEAFAVRHLHHARWSLQADSDPPNGGLAASRDKLVFGMLETTGNVWSLASIPKK